MRHRPHRAWHRRQDDGPPAVDVGSVPADGPGVVLVRVAPTLADRFADLAALLGPGYAVEPGLPTARGLAVLRAATPTTVGFWRARYPRCGLAVLDPFAEHPSAACLDAGADAYVAGPVTTAEVAAILRSLARRVGAVSVAVPA